MLAYGHEALQVAEPRRSYYAIANEWPSPGVVKVRTQMARAYEATGAGDKAFEVYQPALDVAMDFERYAEARRLAAALGADRSQAFTAELSARLQGNAGHRYLLTQIYLSEGDFDRAYTLVENLPLTGYSGHEEIKLVAKAHLIAALGPQADSGMRENLQAFYAEIRQGEKEWARYLRDEQPSPRETPRDELLSRAETLYRRLMQTHIDNGRKTYATAAYYCALLGEIAAHENRLPAFINDHNDFMAQYRRFRALRAEMDLKVGPLLAKR